MSNLFGQQPSVFLNGKKWLSTDNIIVHKEEDRFSEGMVTSVSFAKNGNQTMMIFWQQTSDKSMNFFNRLWIGKVVLYLAGDNVITLLDRDIKGQSIIKQNKKNTLGLNFDNNLYQRYSGYYLTKEECDLLSKNSLEHVVYRTTSTFEKGDNIIEIGENQQVIKNQILKFKN